MYLVLLIVFPLLFLFSPYQAMAALVAGIAGMYFQRTQAAKRQVRQQPLESGYKAGYED